MHPDQLRFKRHEDRDRRNAKIVKLLRARKLTMAEIGDMVGLSSGAIALRCCLPLLHYSWIYYSSPTLCRASCQRLGRGGPSSGDVRFYGTITNTPVAIIAPFLASLSDRSPRTPVQTTNRLPEIKAKDEAHRQTPAEKKLHERARLRPADPAGRSSLPGVLRKRRGSSFPLVDGAAVLANAN